MVKVIYISTTFIWRKIVNLCLLRENETNNKINSKFSENIVAFIEWYVTWYNQ